MSLLESFWQLESSPYLGRLLLDEAAGRECGVVDFTFNLFDVRLDFDAGTATVADVLSEDHESTTDLSLFLERAASFADDPSNGDGLSTLPSGFAADAEGATDVLEANIAPPPVDEILTERNSNASTPAAGGPYTCPCCGHLTLTERSSYEICSECDWEDDGQDDHDSSLVRGGPNGSRSLDQARRDYRSAGGQARVRKAHQPPLPGGSTGDK